MQNNSPTNLDKTIGMLTLLSDVSCTCVPFKVLLCLANFSLFIGEPVRQHFMLINKYPFFLNIMKRMTVVVSTQNYKQIRF